MKEKKRIPTDGEPVQWKSPFAALKNLELPPTPPRDKAEGSTTSSTGQAKNRGRVDIIRQTAHRGGKTVTVVTGFIGIDQDEKERLAKEMKKACGVGGKVPLQHLCCHVWPQTQRSICDSRNGTAERERQGAF